MKNNENGWDNPSSSIVVVKDRDGIIKRVSGRYVWNSSYFEFTGRFQGSSRYPFRGKVRALSSTGATLKKRGNARKKILEEAAQKNKKVDERKLNVERQYYCQIVTEAEIKRRIVEAVEKLYLDNSELIDLQIERNARPDNISPITAANLKAQEFVAVRHQRASDTEREKYVKRIRNICAKLSNKPMKDFGKSEIKKWSDENGVGSDSLRELNGFWGHCVEYGICAGNNPVELPAKRKKSHANNAAKLTHVVELTPEMVNKFYDILNDSLTDASLGVGLMLSGFDPKDIVKLKWKDIVFHKEEDFVVVRHFIDMGSNATKNYSRPAVPRVALMLRRHYANVVAEVGEEAIGNVYVVRNSRGKGAQYKAQYLVQEATRIINLAGVSFRDIDAIRNDETTYAAARKILMNTYTRHIMDNCKLKDDSGTANFLLGRSFKLDTTSSSYTSFTAPEAERRLYTILCVLRENTTMRMVTSTRKAKDGIGIIETFSPKHMHDFVGVSGKIVLEPGEELAIMCPHGVLGHAEILEESK